LDVSDIVWFCPYGVFLNDRVSIWKCKAKRIHDGKEGSCVPLLLGQESKERGYPETGTKGTMRDCERRIISDIGLVDFSGEMKNSKMEMQWRSIENNE